MRFENAGEFADHLRQRAAEHRSVIANPELHAAVATVYEEMADMLAAPNDAGVQAGDQPAADQTGNAETGENGGGADTVTGGGA